jgi:hypothetical protein
MLFGAMLSNLGLKDEKAQLSKMTTTLMTSPGQLVPMISLLRQVGQPYDVYVCVSS